MVYKWEDKYLISSLTEHGRFPHKFLCVAEKKGIKFNVVGYEPTAKIDTFKEQVSDYLSKLEYDSEYFNPMLRKGYKEIMYVHDYLTSLGFKNHHGDIYILKPKNIYGGVTTSIHISFSGLDKSLFDEEPKDVVTIVLHTGDYSWVNVEVNRDFKSLRRGIDSVLKPLMVTEGIKILETSENMMFGGVEYIINSLRGLDITSENYTSALKNKLLEIANSL